MGDIEFDDPDKVVILDDECAGFGATCLGPANPCFESRRDVAVKWSYVGEGKGGYAVVQDFNYVGDSKGSYNPQTVVTESSIRPRLWFVCCLMAVLVIGSSVLIIMFGARPRPRPVPPPVRSGYSCWIAGGSASPVTRALIDAAWRCADSNSDDAITAVELKSCKDLAPAVVKMLAKGDQNNNKMLSRQEFEQALSVSQESARTGTVDSYWKLTDQNSDDQVTQSELQSVEAARLLPAGVVAALLTSDADSDGVLSSDEFSTAVGQSTQGGGQLAQAAWLIADRTGSGQLSSVRLEELAAWANLPLSDLQQLIPSGHSLVTRNDFLAAMAALPVEQWSPHQKNWCCQHKGVCLTTSSTTPFVHVNLPYNCHDGYGAWWTTWPHEKQSWCCEHFNRACPHTAPPSVVPMSQPFDCEAGYSNWQKGWSEKKKDWCCRHFQRGCVHFHCNEGDEHIDWTSDKKAYCCSLVGRGCPKVTTSPPFDCHAGFSNWQMGWSDKKKDWCCQNWHRGCPEAPQASEPFDCGAGYANWNNGWSADKKAWCCTHYHRGCHVVTTTVRMSQYDDYDWFDCRAGYSDWKHRWSDKKQAWCCHHQKRGCTDHVVFDCRDGLSHWQHLWSDDKKDYCCAHLDGGCPGHLSYNCSAGLSNFHVGWSDRKKEWCCHQEHRGCETKVDRYDCNMGFREWKTAWSHKQQDWCCRHHRRGCAFDCSAGLSRWETGWSDEKKHWCCKHSGLGCSN